MFTGNGMMNGSCISIQLYSCFYIAGSSSSSSRNSHSPTLLVVVVSKVIATTKRTDRCQVK